MYMVKMVMSIDKEAQQMNEKSFLPQEKNSYLQLAIHLLKIYKNVHWLDVKN